MVHIFSVAILVANSLLLTQSWLLAETLLFNEKQEHYFSGITHVGTQEGVIQTTSQIMAGRHEIAPRQESRIMPRPGIKLNHERRRRQYRHSPEIAFYPPLRKAPQELIQNFNRDPQVIATNFTGGTLADANAFPPDSMGAIGPRQFIVAINGLIRSFNKTTGVADGVINIDTDAFFASVRNGDFTSDPRIRYDRFSGRWFIIMINVPNDFSNNRIMIAVSSGSNITPSTTWTFFYFTAGDGNFFDYPTLGVDVNALYIGGQTFPSDVAEEEEEEEENRQTRAENTGQAFVVRKSSIFGTGPIVVTEFDNLIDPITGIGPYVPQGVDNFDSNATEGHFIGVDNAFFGRLILRRVSDPAGSPTISSNIAIVIPTTEFPILVPHLGNTNGQAGRLDSIDDRLFMAHVRDGNLWTAHNLGVDNNGISSSSITRTRNGSRWYQINVGPLIPELIQVGTLFAPSETNTTDQRFYWMPSLMTSGQGHMALGCSIAGTNEHINSATAGRLATDELATLQPITLCTNTLFAYNPPDNPGGQRGRRWGDYSYTSLDPSDNMTMWTIQEFCNTPDSWGVRVTKLLAPPPAKPISASPSRVARKKTSVNVTITGSSIAGSGFYDPGAGFSSRISAAIGGVKVNTVTYINPTSVTLNISTVGATKGLKNVTIINPDGQQRSTKKLIKIT